MPSKDELKAMVCREIDRRSDEIIGVAKTVMGLAEPGYREVKTSHFIAEKFSELGITCRTGLAITGIKGVVSGCSAGPTVGVIGELDSLIVPKHPEANPQTGAAHACGHNAQLGMLIGAAAGIYTSGVLSFISGRVAFMAVPAEEYIELEFRDNLRREGKISFLGGKPELIKLGEFDDVNMAMMTHNIASDEGGKIAMGGTMNGTVAKRIQFIGRGAHAGGMPHRGINALNAAMVALSGIHAQRETFRDDDTVRVHPIITKGGESVNIVPDDVRMETFVRGKTLEAIKDANMKVDRALRAGAMAVGAKVHITTLPGYFPIIQDPFLAEVYRANAISLVGQECVSQLGHHTGSTDMGDLSHVMPAIHPFAGGATGTSHGIDYRISDYELGVINPAKVMAMTVIDLLADDAAKAREVVAKSKPRMTKQEYLAQSGSLFSEEVYEG